MPPTQQGYAAPQPTMPMKLSVGSFIRFGWETFKKRPWFFILAPIGLGLLSGIVQGIGGVAQGLVDGQATYGFGHLVSWLIGNAASIFVSIGTMMIYIKGHDSPETVGFQDAWHPELFWKYLATSILVGAIVVLGFLLFIVPGIIAALTYGMAMYLVVDKGMGPIEAMKESARITKGNRWRLLALGGASALITLLGIICLLLGIFVAVPVVALAGVHAYRKISEAADLHQATPLTGGEKTLVAVGVLIPTLLIVGGILAAVLLASLSAARTKGEAAKNALDMKEMQLGLELYYSTHNAYPPTIVEVGQTLGENNISDVPAYENFTYTPGENNETYQLCSSAALPEGAPQCASSEDESTTTVQ